VLVDAVDGTIARVWNLMPEALNRVIREYRPIPLGPGSCTSSQPIVRTEGQPPSGLLDVDNLYTFLGDTYLFYLFRHGRDSYDDQGATLEAIARYCEDCFRCPLGNAFAGPPMLFGENWAVDDVVAHEFTHNVTASESGLIYTNASGAINESFSDIWGEFVDQTNGHGADSPEARWLIGEELVLATLRNMKNPPQYNQPDRRFSPLYQQPTNTWDNGGVHINSGVCNKLCYLLTDGDYFNGQGVYGLGHSRVIALFYEVQVNLLTSGAGWDELYQALKRATFNLGWNKTDQANFYRACVAVEIAGAPANLWVDKFSTCPTPVGLPSCSFPGIGPFVNVAQGLNAAGPADILHVRAANYNETGTINQMVTIKAENGWVSIGKP
jgi:bacillolysin